ncbi:MAG: hypothetical protein JSR12_10295, partial [Bacteroidetes bacterium]|nr:hypothetical protein [Bacteroidota bacterium]MBS1642733.1 hypothetical protein [Bacteroidota bacterium]
MKKVVHFLFFLSPLTHSYSQTDQTRIDYSNSGLNITANDVFASQPTINGLVHTTISQLYSSNSDVTVLDACSNSMVTVPLNLPYPAFDGTSIILSARNDVIETYGANCITPYDSYYLSTDAFQIGYTFSPGYTYFISMNISGNGPSFSSNIGLATSIGSPQFTTNISNASGFHGSNCTSCHLLDNFLANAIYSNYYSLTYTGSTPNSFNISVPSFTVSNSTSGLNIEALPSYDYGVTKLKINSITITAIPAITPITNLCLSETYSINTTWPVTWDATPLNIVTANPTGNNITLTKITDGDIILIATVSAPDGNTFSVSQNIHVGLPIVLIDNNNITASSNLSTPDYNDVCTLQSTTLTMEVTGATGVTWSGPSHSVANWHTDGNNLVFYFYGNNQQAVFQITATNSCGSITKYYAFNSIDCSGGGDPCGGGLTTFNVSVSPNPSTNKIIVVPNVPPPCNE